MTAALPHLFSTSATAEAMWHVAGWTMLHFLWLGTALLAVGWVVRKTVRRASPHVRYTVSLATLALLAALPLAACGLAPRVERQESRDKSQMAETVTSPDPIAAPPQIIELNTTPPPSRLRLSPPRQDGTLGPRQDGGAIWGWGVVIRWLPWLWLVGTPITFCLLATGLVGTERLRRTGTAISAGPLRETCDRLQQSLGISRRVGIAISERVATPILVGIIKPLILLPPSALTGWSADDLEMVLLHELAHVRRWDNLVNLVQRVVESLLFFHPAVWIVSRWVRADREECCDAVVVHHTNAPEAYATLLLDLAATQPLAGLALAQHPVTTRVRRILKLEDEPMRVSRNTVLLWGTMLLSLMVGLTLVSTQPTGAEESVGVEESEQSTEEPESVDKSSIDGDAIEESDDSEVFIRIAYGEVDRLGIDVIDWLQTIRGLGRVEQVITDENAIVISATRDAHDRIQEFLGQRRSDSPFPTLEEQKLADIAYKVLGLELEKPDDETLARLKELGYDGGLLLTTGKVTNLMAGDILVGLHAWPTTSFAQLNAILTRDDLAELAPLKYHVIRKGGPFAGGTPIRGSGTPGEQAEATDHGPAEFRLATGRLSVNLDAWRDLVWRKKAAGDQVLRRGDSVHILVDGDFPDGRHIEDVYHIDEKSGVINLGPVYGRIHVAELPVSEAEARTRKHLTAMVKEPIVRFTLVGTKYGPLDAQLTPRSDKSTTTPVADAAGSPEGKAELRYDGKTFDEWRNQLFSELKIESRIEAIQAITAFGRAGMGEEAAQVIIDLARQYDFSRTVDLRIGDLHRAIAEALQGSDGIAAKHWLPQLVSLLEEDSKPWEELAFNPIFEIRSNDPAVTKSLKSIATGAHMTPLLRNAALRSLLSQERSLDDEETVAIARKAITGKDPVMMEVVLSGLNFRRLDLFPEQFSYLFHGSRGLRRMTFVQLQSLGGNPQAQAREVLQSLFDVLDDDGRTEDHTLALQATVVLSDGLRHHPAFANQVSEVFEKLIGILIDGDKRLLPWVVKALVTIDKQRGNRAFIEAKSDASKGRQQELEEALAESFNIEWPVSVQ